MSQRAMWCRPSVYLALLGALAWWWLAPLVGRPIMADETLIAENAMQPTYEAHLATGHPPFYQELMRVGALLLGWRFEQLHWLGVFCFLAQLLLVRLLAERLQPRAGLLAALLWCAHPMALQGAVILDIDNTLLAVWTSAWLLVLLELPWPLRARDAALLGFFFFLALWTKFATPWALILALLAHGLQRRQVRGSLRAVTQIILVGGALFAVAAWLYRQWYAFPVAFVHQYGVGSFVRGFHGSALPLVGEWLNRGLRIGLWMNPFLLLLGAWIGWRAWRGRLRLAHPRSGVLWWYVAIIGVGYCLVRGLHFGFAKYHYPMLPIAIALVSAGCTAEGAPSARRHWSWLVGLALVMAVASACIAGDVFYTVNYTVRTALITAPAHARHLVVTLGIRWLVTAGVALLGYVILRRLRPRVAAPIAMALTLLAAMLGTNLATDVYQRTIAHSTTYDYGRSIPEMRALIQWLQAQRATHPHDFWIGAEDAVVYAGLRRYPGKFTWEGPAPMLHALDDPKVRGIIVHPTHNTLMWFRQLQLHPEVRQRLATQFVRHRLGDYTIWVRRETRGQR